MTEGDFDVKLTLGSTSRKFRLLQQRGGKAWQVRELPPQPQVERGITAREGFPPERLLPFAQEDWTWGSGLLNFGAQPNLPGHVLRYADGFGIDTSEVHIAKHGPALLSNVGTLAEVPIQAFLFSNKVWFLCATKLYSWDGTTLTNTWTNAAGTNKHAEVHVGKIYVAYGTAYAFSSDGITFTARALAADRFLSLAGNQLWRAYSDRSLNNSVDPDAASPTWSATATADDPITNLFALSGLPGVATQASLFVVDSDINLVELNRALRQRRSANAFKLKAESGSDIWLSDTLEVMRVTAQSFDVFDVRMAGPFWGYDDRPVDSPAPGAATIKGMGQDLDAVYIAATRGTDLYIYKGVPVVRDIYAWSPLLKVAVTGAVNLCEVFKMSGDAAPIAYFHDGAVVKRFSTRWTTYTADWELHTPYFTATLDSWTKMAYRLRAYLERETNTKVSCFYMKDTEASWTAFGGVAPANEMDDDGLNSIALTTPLSYQKIRLRFAGNTTNSANKVNLRSLQLEGALRPDLKRVYDFIVVADTKGDADFLYSLRSSSTNFLSILDRFGTTRTTLLMPGFPVELEIVDEVRKEPVRAYQVRASEV